MEIVLYLSIVSLCFCIGKYFADKEKEMSDFFTELLNFLESFYIGISNHRNVQSIFAQYFFDNTNKLICTRTKEELITLLQGKKYKRDEGTVKAVIDFFEGFGKSNSYDKEKKDCFEILERVRSFCESFIQNSCKRNEMYRKLGLIFGITICIIIM